MTRKRILLYVGLLASAVLVLTLAPDLHAQDDFSIPGEEPAEPAASSSEKSGEVASDGGSMSLLEMILAGGWSMVILGIFSLAVIGLLIYSLIDLQKKNFYPESLVSALRGDMESANLEAAIGKVQSGDSCMGEILRAGYEHVGEFGYESIQSEDIRLEMANAAKRFNRGRARTVNFFSILAQASPMVGLLGTVSGMIGAFGKLSQGGSQGNPNAFAGSISEALITTASGLVVALPSIFCYFIFRDRLQGLVAESNDKAKEMLKILRRSVAAFQQPGE